MNARLDQLKASSYLYSTNAPYLEQLYERYLEDPSSVEPHWRAWFDQMQSGPPAEPAPAAPARVTTTAPQPRAERPATGAVAGALRADAAEKQAAVLRLINAYRVRGHQQAQIDPLQLTPRPPVPDLDPGFHGLDDNDLNTEFNTGSLFGPEQSTLRDILDRLRHIYTDTIGAEYMHITNTAEKRWIQERLEGNGYGARFSQRFQRHILERLIAAEGLERYLHTRYVGQKRFSLEGGESLIPLLDDLIQRAGAQGIHEIVLGMAHRGRLNVLVNVMGKAPSELFEEFEGRHIPPAVRSGDVKYHLGFSADASTPGGNVHLALSFNPSHLEIIDPVVEGSVRARQHRRDDHDGSEVLAVLMHGDAAFAGQGVVMENFNMSQARGFGTGGTMHIVVNNMIGFTTSNPLDTRSTLYCTDVAKMVQAPIFHVNGDDPEAVIFVAQMALDFRMTFKKDVIIDMVCYRRLGHNEADEPAVTQPMMYHKIREHTTVPRLYAQELEAQGVLEPDEADQMGEQFREALDRGNVVALHTVDGVHHSHAVDWTPFSGNKWTHPADTAIALSRVQDLTNRLLATPDGFELHSRVANIMGDRRKMAAGALPIDWGFAETLAYASLLEDGYQVRLTGQDSGRGTFFHRHAVLFNQKDGVPYIPLQHLGDQQAKFIVIDSLLSEEAVLGFEYGYSTAEPNSLTIWEAQFGDFANGAQVVIDQFISSGEAKWGRMCGITLFLPHGYEGQGPEHSSARLERYLQLCAEFNMQICVPSTPAQMFHMLRRQMLRPYRKPLVVMTPKSLLRHRLSASSLDDLAEGSFQPVIGEVDDIKPASVQRVVLCAGKVYYDLLQKRRDLERDDVAIIRIEQLYPFPREALTKELARYNRAKDVIWCQEEPMNQGAWYPSQHHFRACMRKSQQLQYAGRKASASPAAGYFDLHIEQQRTLVEEALGG
ncbi:MAG: 2-oxoglutarate dehydrogenase E1 component [Gammaproteobacteria bacterium]